MPLHHSSLEEVIRHFGQAFDSDSAGDQLSSILSDLAVFGHMDGLSQKTQDLYGGKLQELNEDIFLLLRS